MSNEIYGMLALSQG